MLVIIQLDFSSMFTLSNNNHLHEKNIIKKNTKI